MLLVGIHNLLQRDAHVLCQVLARGVELHDTTAGVVLGVPDDLIGCSLVQTQAKGRLVLPHLSSDIVTSAQLVAEAVAIGIQDDATNTSEGLRGQELHLGIGIVRLHQTGGVHLDPLEVNGGCTDGLSHLDGITSAVLAVGGGEVEQVRPVRGQEGIGAKVGAETAGGEDHRAELLHGLAGLLVLAANHGAGIDEQLVHLRLRHDASSVGFLSNLLQHLDQRIGDGHSWEALLAAVRAGLGVPSQARDEGEIEVELVHEPVNIRSAVGTQHLGKLRLLRAALQRVGNEDFRCVRDGLSFLRLGPGTVDAAGGLGAVPSAEGGLVQQNGAATKLHHGVGGGHACQAAAYHDHLIGRENCGHGAEVAAKRRNRTA